MSAFPAADVEYNLGGSRTRILVSGAQTSNAYCVLEMQSPAGRATPAHRHENEDETLLMLEGELDVIVDGAQQRLVAGSTVVLSRGTRHQLINAGTQAARYLVICAPAGFDRFVQACADAQPAPIEPSAPTDADKARMREAATRFDITLYPPAAPV